MGADLGLSIMGSLRRLLLSTGAAEAGVAGVVGVPGKISSHPCTSIFTTFRQHSYGPSRVLSVVTCLVSVGGGGRPGEDDVHVPAAAPQQPPRLLHAHTPQTRPGNIHKLVPLLEPPVSETVYF